MLVRHNEMEKSGRVLLMMLLYFYDMYMLYWEFLQIYESTEVMNKVLIDNQGFSSYSVSEVGDRVSLETE